MRYKDYHTLTFENPDWEKAEKDFINEWNEILKNEPWHYPDHDETEAFSDDMRPRVKPLESPDDKFNFLIKWEALNKEKDRSPLHQLVCKKGIFYSFISDPLYYVPEKMGDSFVEKCIESFIDENMPDVHESKTAEHRTNLKGVFKRSDYLNIECENRIYDIIQNHYLFSDLCLLVKYDLPDTEEMRTKLQSKYEKIIRGCKWKVMGEDGKLQKPLSPVEYLEQFNDDDENILERIFSTSKNSLHDEIRKDSIKTYCLTFAKVNVNQDLKDSIFEDSSALKLEKIFNTYYQYLAEDFSEYVLSTYDKTYVLELFAD